MELLRFRDVECHYGAREIFSAASGVIRSGDRLVLVGRNGAGKSSLLRLLAGVEAPFGGEIVRAKEASIGYLAQNVADERDATLEELIEASLSRAPHDEYGVRRKRLRTLLADFGFTPEDATRSLQTFSGGQRSKAALAHLLIGDPDLLVLDEPTNHLDIETVRWLESYIAADKRAYLMVSHDRYFIDRTATHVWELERARLYAYPPEHPAYSRYLVRKHERLDEERRAYESFTEEREKRRKAIADLRATRGSHDYAQVKSREKQLARIELSETAPAPAAPSQKMSLRLETGRVGHGFAIEAMGLSKSYSAKLFEHLDLAVERGGRLAIVGPNGAGKSTLLGILAGQIMPDRGGVRYNEAVRPAYFAQNARDQLDPQKSAFENVLSAADITPERARAFLGRMRLGGEAAEKPVSTFSGGERRRIILAALMAQGADVLLLDEPSNDLDIESREALEEVLAEFDGAIIAVSHDRYLLSRICSNVLWIDGGEWGVVQGGYDAYEAWQRERESAQRRERERMMNAEAKRAGPVMTPLKVLDHLRRDIGKAEREISKLDERKAEIERIFTDPAIYADTMQVKALQIELEEIGARSRAALERWESLSERLENALN
ncbi:MAG: ABC-F family ATP-binding cassette domain-containing protein [Candidatus Eremiobacteraeota bacterium]|nr:ABC-F family ATP-binding cassette domain-containing protein [Candidatus Eremiobacteraeota bacterium]